MAKERDDLLQQLHELEYEYEESEEAGDVELTQEIVDQFYEILEELIECIKKKRSPSWLSSYSVH